MTDQPLTAADAALRERITELSVHIPCGGLRGPAQRTLWQSGSSGNGVQVRVADIRLFRKWSAGEGGGYPRREVVSVS